MEKLKKFLPSTNIYIVFTIILILILALKRQFIIAGISLIFFIIAIICYKYDTKNKEKQWQNFLEDFSNRLDVATQNTLVNLPFPMIILDNDGKITWYNSKFTAIVDNNNFLGKSITDILKDWKPSEIIKNKNILYKYVNLNDEVYDIYGSWIDIDEKYSKNKSIIILYFYNVTSLKKALQNRESIMLIEVDNLDEVLKGVEESKRPILSAEIESTIMNYAHKLDAMIKKYSSNKYILSIQDNFILEEMKKKFDILDTVREISFGNKIAVTLSVGIGRLGESPMINNNYANSAKELALGRGGDQVVIKSGEKLNFFGGKTKEVEKRTKVRARVIAHALRDLINESSKVYIMGHRNPDMDCFGAAIGLAGVIKSLGKECKIVLKEKNEAIKCVMDKMEEDEAYKDWLITPDRCLEELDDNSLLILVDVHSRSYVQDEDIINRVANFVIIDHHRRTVDFIEGAIITYIEIYASSTSELVTEMIQYMMNKPILSQLQAEALLAGICIDTKNFSLKTGVRTFEAASFLRQLGADPVDVKKMFGHDLNSYIRKSDIIRNAEVNDNIAIAMSPTDIEDTILAAQAADELLNITGIQASFVLVKIKEDVCISGRSFGDINVQLILESLGGGGHLTMAGTKINDVTIEEAKIMLKDAIGKYLKEGEKK